MHPYELHQQIGCLNNFLDKRPHTAIDNYCERFILHKYQLKKQNFNLNFLKRKQKQLTLNSREFFVPQCIISS